MMKNGVFCTLFLHIGENCSVFAKSVIGIFDFEVTTTGSITREYLKVAEKENRVTYVSEQLPKSFVITAEYGGEYVYISPISAATLNKRLSGLLSGEFYEGESQNE
jgi:hypothetical protein